MAINHPSGRGADVSVLDLVGIPKLLGNIATIGFKLLGVQRGADKEMAKASKEWKSQALQDSFATAIGETFWSKRTPPKLGVFEYTLVDNRGHLVGPHTEDARRSLREVDRQVGRVLDTIERRGIADSTAIVLTADHGMEHQDLDTTKLGGWFEALDRAAADGARTKESTRFVYVRSVDWKVDGAVPAAGTTGNLTISVVNDDADASGLQPTLPGATVTVRDAAGGVWTAVTDAEGRVHLPIAPKAGPLRVTVEHVDFSREVGTIALPGRV